MAEAQIGMRDQAHRSTVLSARAEVSRAYLARLAETLLTPAERAERAERALASLKAWNGYAPTPSEQEELDDELDRRLAQVTGR